MSARLPYCPGAQVVIAGACLLAACGSPASGAPASDDGGTTDAPTPADGASGEVAADAGTTGSLTLSLDPSLDQPGNDVKARSITTAVMRGRTGATARTATISGGAAVFDLAAVAAGDYFVEINGDADDLVPTRIDDPRSVMTQRVGQQLRASYIGPPDSPAYRINTYSAGQKQSPAVRFSDGNAIAGEQAYVLYAFATSQLEIDLLGSARPLTSLALPRCVGHPGVPSDGWLLNTTNEDHHGDLFNADGGTANCGSCHWDYWMKKPSFGDIAPSRGWCFRCHYGAGGASAGLIDPTQ